VKVFSRDFFWDFGIIEMKEGVVKVRRAYCKRHSLFIRHNKYEIPLYILISSGREGLSFVQKLKTFPHTCC